MASTVRAYDVAAMFLRALGAPVTPSMQRAVAIWLRFESGGTITGNNPWNLHNGDACTPSVPGYVSGYCPGAGNLPGQIGNRYAGPGDKNVAVFRTMDDGTKASAQNLIRLAGHYGYGSVISQARAGNALGFLIAVQNSSWSAGHYSYTKLVGAFRSSFNYNTLLTTRFPAGVGDTPAGPPAPGVKMVSFPFRSLMLKLQGITGTTTFTPTLAKAYAVVILDTPAFVHAITGSDALLTGDAWDAARLSVQQQAAEYSGKPVSALPETIDVYFQPTATTPSGAQGPLESIAAALGDLGNIFGFLIDPQNWLYIIALGGGFLLAGYGFAQLTGARGLPHTPGSGDDGDVPVVDDLAPVQAVTIVRREDEAA